jgi:lysophospholipase L1-like esterase
MKRRFSTLVLLLLAACTNTPVMPTVTPIPTPKAIEMPKLRYLALGDSYTIGESVEEPERWPNQLSGLLEAKGFQVDVTIDARTGWTVKELWDGVQANPPTGTYNIVSLLIGVNDQYRGYPSEGYREDFRFMLGKAIEYAGGDPKHVVVLSIPDWGVTPFGRDRSTEFISMQINEFNAINLEETQKAGAYYVDVTDISRIVMTDLDLLASDGLHPSGKMYAMWAENTLPVALKILSYNKGE